MILKLSQFINKARMKNQLQEVKKKPNAFQEPQLQIANTLFLQKQYEPAIQTYQKFIKDRQPDKTVIDGLGNNELSIGYYEWFLGQWYRDRVEDGQYNGTAYDMLSLAYLGSKTKDDVIQKGIKWYRSMLGLYPNSYQLHLGLANILGNKAIYEQAIEEYNAVLDLKPDWVRPLECITYIYEYKRIEKPKAVETANKILEMDPINRVALFVLARNEKNPDNKIQKLKRVTQLHPRYARAFNEIGIVYGGTKKLYDEAILWYTKCSEVAPKYASCYNNIGVNQELKKQYQLAIQWYFRGIEKDKEYKAPHKNMSDIFEELEYTDEQIEGEMMKRKVEPDYFYYYMGLSYYDKKKYDTSLKYYMKSYDNLDLLSKDIHKLHNSTGITYDEMRNNDQALSYYQKCIAANPKYHSAYYNIAIVYKRMNKTDEAINWYKRAIEINPRYSYAYNNLGNIYKNQRNFEEAIKCYRKAVEYLSTYTLALANMGVCYLKINNYRQAFYALERAKEILPTDNNNLSESNKSFLRDTIDQFDKEGQIWRQNGVVTEELKSHLQNYQSAFKQLYNNQGKEPVNHEKVMKSEVLEIMRLSHQDKFELKSIDTIYHLLKKCFESNEEYFHILPQLFIQFFFNNAIKKQRPVADVQTQLHAMTKKLLVKVYFESSIKGDAFFQQRNLEGFPFLHFDPFTSQAVNLFKPGTILNEYSQLYGQLIKINEITKESYKEFKNVVDQIRKQSHGIPYGVQIKIPSQEEEQLPVMLDICHQLFEDELTPERSQVILKEVFQKVNDKFKSKENISLKDFQHYIKKVWAGQITQILQKRKQHKKETKCPLGDLLKGKIIFECVDHIKKALTIADAVCHKKGHKIMRMQNNLLERQQEVVLTIQVKQAVCQLKLALKQDETHLHFINNLQRLQNSPIGTLLNSALFLCKQVQYSFYRNCQDVAEFLTEQKNDEVTLGSALFILERFNESRLAAE